MRFSLFTISVLLTRRSLPQLKLFIAIFFCGVASALLGTGCASDSSEKQMEQTAAEIAERARTDPTAYSTVSNLAIKFPGRFDGTEGEHQAALWLSNNLALYADANTVKMEHFPIHGWLRGKELCEIEFTNGATEPLRITTLGPSVATPADGKTARVHWFKYYSDLTNYVNSTNSLSNEIVFVSEEMRRPTLEGGQYGPASQIRRNGASEAGRRGAVAFLLCSVGSDEDVDATHTGSVSYADGTYGIPAAALSIKSARRLAGLAANGDVWVRLVLTPRDRGIVTSWNVIGEIRGTERSNKVVVVAAHYDCWDICPGALDDGAGCGIAMGLMKLIHDLPPEKRPKCTIRVIFFGSEETGLWGGKAYVTNHLTELKANCVMATEADDGQGRVWRFRTNVRNTNDPSIKVIARDLRRLGIEHGPDNAEGVSEVGLFFKAALPVANLDMDTRKYWIVHHTSNDTLVNVEPKLLNKTTAAYAVFAYLSAELGGRSQWSHSGEAHAQTAALSSIEQKIAQAVDANNSEALNLLVSAVNINSDTMNFDGVKRVAELFRPKLEALGFSVKWIDGTRFHRAGHFVAEHPGPGAKGVLIGHVDTVFKQNSASQTFKRIDASTATGPGIIDMKGGDTILLFALQALKDTGQLEKMNITVVFSGDEEDAGQPIDLARKALRDAAKGAKWALDFEDGSGDPTTAITARRGSTVWTLRTMGLAGHGALIFSKDIGAGAVFEMARIVNGFYEKFSMETNLAVNPGLVIGGTTNDLDATGSMGSASGKHNVVARQVIVTGDMRTVSAEQLERTKAAMREIIAGHLPQTGAEIEFNDAYPSMPPSAGNDWLLNLYSQVSIDLGQGPVSAVPVSKIGGSDVVFVASLVPMIIDGLGLSGSGGHTEKETADLSTLPAKTKRTAVLLYRLANAATDISLRK